jgi:glutamate---cysteine ligase / carboxylate-amine ligase
MLTLGVEEEFFVIESENASVSLHGMPGLKRLIERTPAGLAGFDYEFQAAIVESRTGIHRDLSTLRAELTSLRRELTEQAQESRLSIASCGTIPVSDWKSVPVVDKSRYADAYRLYGDVVRQRLTCGCHVHVGLPDRDLAVRVLAEVRPWLPLLLAISVSSPFNENADSGYQSSRMLLWGGFPAAGIPPAATSYQEYQDVIAELTASGVVLDPGNIYWDARLSANYDTLEFRISDACTRVDEAVLQAALSRALVATLAERDRAESRAVMSTQMYRAAIWQAARYGLEGQLLHPLKAEAVAAEVAIEAMLEYLRPALEEAGDWGETRALTSRLLTEGTSARRQRRVFDGSRQLGDIVGHVVTETGR